MKRHNIYVVTTWDDTTTLDVKISDLLDKYEIKGTFFVVNSWMGKRISLDDLFHVAENHELGAHTVNHVNLTQVSVEEARMEISESKRRLEEVLEKTVTSFAYPWGNYSQIHIKIVQDSGYLCARTTKPFSTKPVDSPYELPVTVWTAPHRFRDIERFLQLVKFSPRLMMTLLDLRRWSEFGRQVFDALEKSGGVFHLFGHARELEAREGWTDLENLLAFIGFRKNAIYLTMSEYARTLRHPASATATK